MAPATLLLLRRRPRLLARRVVDDGERGADVVTEVSGATLWLPWCDCCVIDPVIDPCGPNRRGEEMPNGGDPFGRPPVCRPPLLWRWCVEVAAAEDVAVVVKAGEDVSTTFSRGGRTPPGRDGRADVDCTPAV